jgi:predicted metal-binding membrane protein
MPWRAMEFIFVFAMWTVMMVGMMTPPAAPMILMYARVGRQVQAHGRPLTGYSLFWRRSLPSDGQIALLAGMVLIVGGVWLFSMGMS